MAQIVIDDVVINVVRKNVKNMNFRITPNSDVRISVPYHAEEADILYAINTKMRWIKKHLARLENHTPRPVLKYRSGETHYFLGDGYTLNVISRQGHPKVILDEDDKCMDLYVRPRSTIAQRQKVLREWYRKQLKIFIPQLIAEWEPIMGVKVADWGVKRMKTKWGTCNITARRIWLNLELATKPFPCLEYVVVHEMVHLLERYHNKRFWALMDKFLPDWPALRDELNGKDVD